MERSEVSKVPTHKYSIMLTVYQPVEVETRCLLVDSDATR